LYLTIKNSGFIIRDITAWLATLGQFEQVKHHFALLEDGLWKALNKNSPKTEPGYFTLQLTWHACCHVGVDYVEASESCSSPIPRTVYPAMLSVFATEKKK
jgi:hypothetical protein